MRWRRRRRLGLKLTDPTFPHAPGGGAQGSLVSPRVAALLPQPFDNQSTVRRFEALWGRLLPLCLSNDYAAH